MSKLVCGIGFNSKGEYKTYLNGKRAYTTWYNMIRRCYDPEYHEKRPTYLDCHVCDEWLDYQCFAQWYENQTYNHKGYEIDKDLLMPKNKIYSPETCCFVPSQLNSLLVDCGSVRGEYPQGVSFDRIAKGFQAHINFNGKRKKLGCFDDPKEAYQVYKAAKERHVKNEALKWANSIQWEVFVALMNWELS